MSNISIKAQQSIMYNTQLALLWCELENILETRIKQVNYQHAKSDLQHSNMLMFAKNRHILTYFPDG